MQKRLCKGVLLGITLRKPPTFVEYVGPLAVYVALASVPYTHRAYPDNSWPWTWEWHCTLTTCYYRHCCVPSSWVPIASVDPSYHTHDYYSSHGHDPYHDRGLDRDRCVVHLALDVASSSSQSTGVLEITQADLVYLFIFINR